MLSRFRRLGYKICVSDEESFWVYVDPAGFLDSRVSAGTLGCVEYYFAWGKRQASAMCESYPQFSKQIVVTGTPRADVWRKEYSDFYTHEVAAIKNKYGKYILLPSNFSGVVNIKGPDFVIAQAKKYQQIKTPADERQLRDRMDHVANNLELFIKACHAIRNEFKDHAIIVRPHPTDDHGFWRNAVAEINNCHVVYEGSPAPWLLGADAIFHHGCSTGIEARIMGKCSVAYHPLRNKVFDSHPSTMIGPVVESESKLLEFIGKSISLQGDCECVPAKVEEYMEAVRGELSCDRVVDYLDKIVLEGDQLSLGWGSPYAALDMIHEGYRDLRKRFRLYGGVSNNRRLVKTNRTKQKWPGSSVEELNDMICRYNELNSFARSVAVRKLRDDIFYLSGVDG
jgi:surface carbohydrate biosynthesis protein